MREQTGKVKHQHTHTHNWEGGERSFTHIHSMPMNDQHLYANRLHKHSNGWHSHPHNHTEYEDGNS